MSESLTVEDIRAQRREYQKQYRANKKAMKLATGKALPKEPRPVGRPKSIVNRATEYGALFTQLNEERVDKGLKPLVTAMETLIEAMQPENGLEIKDRARIAEKIATFESSRAPIISIEHVQNLTKDEELDADDALDDFLTSIRKV